MKKQHYLISFILILCLVSVNGLAQDKSNRPSPPAQAKATVEGASITIDYSQPALKGRNFGGPEFHPYGKVWRTGANEASWIETSEDIMINGKKLPKGKYGFFTIPGEEKWTLIFNSVWDQWGAYDYDDSQDVLRVKADVKKASDNSERFTIKLDENGNGSLNWGDFMVAFTVKKA